MKTFLAGAALCMSAALCLIACGGTEHGKVTGFLQMIYVDPPYGIKYLPFSGTVILVSTSGFTYYVHVGASGRFAADVPTGTYTVTGPIPDPHRTGDPTCLADRGVTVKTGAVTHVVVTCLM